MKKIGKNILKQTDSIYKSIKHYILIQMILRNIITNLQKNYITQILSLSLMSDY